MPFKRAPSCATGPNLSSRSALAHQRRDVGAVRLQRLLQLASLADEGRELLRDGHAALPDEREEGGADLGQLAIELPSDEGSVELALPDLRPDDHPVSQCFQ